VTIDDAKIVGLSLEKEMPETCMSEIGKSSESVQCAVTGPCLRMRHRLSA